MQRRSRTGRVSALMVGLAAVLLMVPASFAVAGSVLYVDDDAPSGGNGQTWDTAFRYLQDALTAAQPGSGVEEIHVGQGTYKPDQDEGGNVTPGDREASFELIDAVALMGGYAGFGAPDPDERNVDAYETILTGDLNGDDQEPYENMGDNSGHVLKGFGLGQPTRLDGFTVTRGYAEEGEIEDWWGAGLWLEESDLQVDDCTFLRNLSDGGGAGLYSAHGSPCLQGCRFEANKTDELDGWGGGVEAWQIGSDNVFTMTDCEFVGNVSREGGGAIIYMPAIVVSCTFIDNDVPYGPAGGLGITGPDSVVRDCHFIDNHCYGYGAGLAMAWGGERAVIDCTFTGNVSDVGCGGLSCDEDVQVLVRNCRFENNTTVGDYGGAMNVVNDASAEVLSCDFVGNKSRFGAGVFAYYSHGLSMRNCRFFGNEADITGGGIYYDQGSYDNLTLINCLFSGNLGAYAGAVGVFDTPCYFWNCTIAWNRAWDTGGGITVDGGHADVVNCILWDNYDQTGTTEFAQLGLFGSASADVTSSCIQNLNYYQGPGNIGDDPLFLDPDGADNVFGTIDDDLHPKPGSVFGPGAPCIDAGDNAAVGLCALDLDSLLRRADDPYTPDTGFGDPPIVDMGAFEAWGPGGLDCNYNALDDDCEIAEGWVEDCNQNDIPDECDIADGVSIDCNDNGIPDECEEDCNNNGIADECDIRDGFSEDCNENGIPDECDIADGISEDCNENGVPDECDIADGISQDCNGNNVPDECDIADGISEDCNDNIVPDECELSLRPVGKLYADDGEPDDHLGYSVALSGNVAISGTKYDDDNGVDSGSAYAFFHDGIGWLQEAKLLPSDGGEYQFFGGSVDLSGDTAVIGANQDDDLGKYSGSAYVFTRRHGGEWLQLTKLLADDGWPYDYFGTSVAIEGDTIMVGAPAEDDAGTNSGAVYVFTCQGSDWVQVAKLHADDAVSMERFGCSVAMDGDTALIGAEGDDDNGSSAGSAYVFTYDGSNWAQEAKLLADDGAVDDYFGRHLSVRGDTAVVTAEEDDDKGPESGSAYVFVRSGRGWVQQAKLIAADGGPGDRFGGSCAVEGHTIVIGAPYDKTDSVELGSAYVFIRDADDWTQEARFVPEYDSDEVYFGYSVDISGQDVLVGAMDDDNGSAMDTGSLYVFHADSPDCNFNGIPDDCDIADGVSDDLNGNGIPDECECIADVNGDGTVDIDDLFQVLGIWGACDDCPEDLNGDGVVDIDDLFAVLAEWGPCS